MFPTEDGYLMLQVARNLATGSGLSTAAGTIPTNGVQPLATFLWAGAFWLVQGDKTAGVALVLALEIALSGLAAFAILRLGRTLFRASAHAGPAAALAAAAWWASPVALPHTMNCLESSLYALLVLLATCAFAAGHARADGPWTAGRCLGLGVLLGGVFWARNDGVFFVLGVTLVHLLSGARAGAAPRRLLESVAMGTTSILVAAPWLAFNQLRFGSLVPISGQSEAMHVEVAHSLHRVPPVLLEIVGVLLPIPQAMEERTPVVLGAALLLAASAACLPLVIRACREREREIAALVGIYGVCLVLFYGFFFGASHFMARYLFPLSPFLALLGARVASWAWRLSETRRPSAAPLAAAALLLLVAAAHARFYLRGVPHQHFQVVRWVEENVPDATWVAAIQTGTLGYFHDRTLNLDGKVNPEALRARAERRIPAYVLEKDVRFLADWVGIVQWAEWYPEIRDHFEVVVRDPAANLGVLRRLGPAQGGDGARTPPAPQAAGPAPRSSPRASAKKLNAWNG
jgi:hypothetical protein